MKKVRGILPQIVDYSGMNGSLRDASTVVRAIYNVNPFLHHKNDSLNCPRKPLTYSCVTTYWSLCLVMRAEDSYFAMLLMRSRTLLLLSSRVCQVCSERASRSIIERASCSSLTPMRCARCANHV